MATKKPSAAQIAARKRFAEMARAGVFTRKAGTLARKAVKRVANPKRHNPVPVIPAPHDSEPLHAIFSYYVQFFNSVSGLWRTVAAFAVESEAFQYAKAYAKTSRGASKTIRVATPDR